MNGSFGKAPKYVSPFVADALYRAKLRANNAPKATSRQRHTSVRESEDFSGGWDSSVSRNALFDPKIQKQELFKIAPRRPAGKDPEPVEDLPRESQDDDNATRMTRRRSDLSPPRRPRSALQPYPSSSRDIIIRQSVDRSSKDTKEALTTVHGQDLRDPYVKVCNACHGGGGVHNHAHSNGHSQGHSSNRSPARYRSPPQRPHLRQVRAERPSTHPSHPHITSRGNLTRLSQDSLVSRARAEQEAGDDDVVRVVTRATSPIDEITLQYLNEGRDPSWVALSGLDPSQPTENPVLFQHEHHDIAMMPGRRQVPTPAHRTPLQSAYSHQPPPASMASRHDLEAIHMVPGSAFATRSASNKVPYRASLNNSPIRSMAGTPAHNDLNVPKFQSSLDASQFEESFHEANTMQNVYKMQVQAQTQVIESIAKMMETIAGLSSKKDKKRRRRRFQMAPPITVHIGNDAMGHQLPADIPSDQRDTDVVRLIGADSSPSLSKAGIMDLILAKLQSLDKLEKEISNEIHGSNPPADPSFANNPISGLQTSPAFENLDVITKSDKVMQAAIVPDMMSMLGTASPSKVGPAVIATDASKIAQPFSKPAACTIPENLSVFDPSIKSSKIVKASAHTTKEAILYDKQKKNEFRSFVKELENTRAKQEVPYKAQGLSMTETLEMLSDSLFEDFVNSISAEIGKTLDAYAEELFDAI